LLRSNRYIRAGPSTRSLPRSSSSPSTASIALDVHSKDARQFFMQFLGKDRNLCDAEIYASNASRMYSHVVTSNLEVLAILGFGMGSTINKEY
jgi:hypothetical protein